MDRVAKSRIEWIAFYLDLVASGASGEEVRSQIDAMIEGWQTHEDQCATIPDAGPTAADMRGEVDHG
jgi:hypothetical protein